jgi:hypothetical protein
MAAYLHPRRIEEAIAPAAGAMTNQSAMVARSAVPYPNGLIPTLFDRIPAKIIISQALTKKNPPAAGSEKNGLTASPLYSRMQGSLARCFAGRDRQVA